MNIEELTGLNEDELKAKFKKADEIKEILGSYFEKEELEVGVVISVLMSMLVALMKDTGTPPHYAILMFGTLIAKSYEEDDEDESNEEGVAQWVN
jgi:hypothetical protein